jgi:hypothetical protein
MTDDNNATPPVAQGEYGELLADLHKSGWYLAKPAADALAALQYEVTRLRAVRDEIDRDYHDLARASMDRSEAAQARLDALETFVADVAYNAFHNGEPYQLLNSMVSRAQGLVAIKPKPKT